MRSLNEKVPNDSGLYDDLYWELCVLQACTWGVHHVGQRQYDGLYENMTCALLHEFGRVMDKFKALGKVQGAEVDK